MKKQRCIVKIIPISRQGEVRHFQVRIPENTEIITGVETAVRMKEIIALPRQSFALPTIAPGVQPPVGELKLQSCEEANVFYATNITDPSLIENLDKIPTPDAIIENVWTHGYKRELEEVLIHGNTTMLAGIYKDKLGAMQGRDAAYDVFLYVWYKLKVAIDSKESKIKKD